MQCKTGIVALGGLALAAAIAASQTVPHPSNSDPRLDTTGQIPFDGRSTAYLIRHLPVSSFPDLPDPLAALLTERGCLIPQTYQARRPENVIHASFERPGSSDWAVLCSTRGTVSLLVYFSRSPTLLVSLASAPETNRLQVHDVTGALGFNWGIDPASPERVREARAGMLPHPKPLDHDALADSIVDRRTIYRFYIGNTWTVLDMPE